MAERRGLPTTLDPLRAEFERLGALCRTLRDELGRQQEQRRRLERERDGMLAELARRQASPDDLPDRGEITLLRERQRTSERAQQTAQTELAQARAQVTALQAELAAARDELHVGEEERACLAEQIRSLQRSLTLLTAENRLLRQERRPPGGGGRG
ncbi:MAG: hypothetical protein HY906_18050 [Deltaproteobacteria bacterium]|nr:hypothetical protein [Deltaproteobacteria bacterium]